jgi:acetyl esterase/lipase
MGIVIPEFALIPIFVCFVLLLWSYFKKRFKTPSLLIGAVTFIILCSPIWRAYQTGSELKKNLEQSFGITDSSMRAFHQEKPFRFFQMFTGNGAKKLAFKNYIYVTHTGVNLDLNFTASAVPGVRPCLLVVHGGSWTRGNFTEIAHFNNYFANAGYNVATINYRLAPQFPSPAQAEDIHAALQWLRIHATELNIDTTNFILTGRSAGAQLVLTAAYTAIEPGVKGVAAFYGPTDMLWTYDHPDNPLIMDSKKVQRDFLGGTPSQMPERYHAESPLFFITAKTVPTLLVHGQLDAHVYHEQSVRLAKKLTKAGVKNVFLSIPWATHGCEYNLNGPSGQLAMYAMERFMYAVTTAR